MVIYVMEIDRYEKNERVLVTVTIPMYFLKPLVNTQLVVLMVARKNSYLVPFFILSQAYVTSTKFIY